MNQKSCTLKHLEEIQKTLKEFSKTYGNPDQTTMNY